MRTSRWVLVLTAAVCLSSPAVAAASAPVSRDEMLSWRLSKQGLGPLRVGVTVAGIESLTGRQMEKSYGSRSCTQWSLAGAPAGLSLMTAFGRLARVDVYRGGRWRTTKRIGLGTRAGVVRRRYDRVRTEPHPYSNGKYLIVGGRKRGLIFETSARGRVTSFRGGRSREVRYIEGCA